MKQPYLIQQLIDAAEEARGTFPAIDEALCNLEDVQVILCLTVEEVVDELECTPEKAREYLYDAATRMYHSDVWGYLHICQEFENDQT